MKVTEPYTFGDPADAGKFTLIDIIVGIGYSLAAFGVALGVIWLVVKGLGW